MNLKGTISLVITLCFPLLIYSSIYQNKTKNEIDSSKVDHSKLYEVTETITMPFGSSKITYTVRNKNLINTNDLGPNNTRVIKEKTANKTAAIDNNLNPSSNNINEDTSMVISSKKSSKTIAIDPLETYERMIDKGIKSIDIYKKLGDSYFYKNDYMKASKYYEALFKMTNDLIPEYYFRYSHALMNIGQAEKSADLEEKYKTLTAKQ
jgi:tetratricopeptide (TPR) repeat protein